MSLVSDGGTMFSAPFAKNDTALPHLSFFAWVKFKAVAGSQSIVHLASLENFNTGLDKAGVGIGALVASQLDDYGQNIFAADEDQAALSGAWYAVFGSMTMRQSTRFKSTQTPSSSIFHTGIGNASSHWDQIQFLGKQINDNPPGAFLSAGSKLAEFAIWDTILAEHEYDAMVFQGFAPGHIRKQNQICYCPLRMHSGDLSKYHHSFTPFGTGKVTFDGEHPILNRYTAPIPKIFLFSHGIDGFYSDTFTASDALVASTVDFAKTLSDTSSVVEGVTLFNLVGTVDDRNGSDDLLVATGFPGNWSDSVATSDRIPLLYGNKYDNNVNETVASTDVYTGVRASFDGSIDTNGSTDSVTLGPIPRSYSDTNGSTDAYTVVTLAATIINDNVATSDQVRATMYLATLSDVVTTSASVISIAFNQQLSLTDTVATPDNLTVFFRPKALSDVVATQTFVDTVLSINQTARNDFITISDHFSSNFDLSFGLSDTGHGTDVVITNFMMASTDHHDFAASSDFVNYISFRTILSDAIHSSDTFVSTGAASGLQMQFSVITSDAVTGRGAFVATIGDIVATPDAVSGGVGFFRTIADSVASSTTIPQTFARVGILSDTFHATDQYGSGMVVPLTFADAGVTSDNYPLPLLNSRSMTDSGVLSEILVPSLLNFNWTLSDMAIAVDVLPIEGEVFVPPITPIIPPASSRSQKLRERWLIERGP